MQKLDEPFGFGLIYVCAYDMSVYTPVNTLCMA